MDYRHIHIILIQKLIQYTYTDGLTFRVVRGSVLMSPSYSFSTPRTRLGIIPQVSPTQILYRSTTIKVLRRCGNRRTAIKVSLNTVKRNPF